MVLEDKWCLGQMSCQDKCSLGQMSRQDKWSLGQMSFRTNGVQDKWSLGQMSLGQVSLGQMCRYPNFDYKDCRRWPLKTLRRRYQGRKKEVFFYDYWAKQYFSTTTVQQYAILDNDRNFRKLIASSNQSIMYMS